MILRKTDTRYPEMLRLIPDPPEKLYVVGNLINTVNRDNRAGFAVVGSRRATKYGLDMAYSISRELSENGMLIISGLAEGVDAAAHRGALDGGGGTVAVLGCGADVYYPAVNRKLQRAIASAGSLVSEHPPGTQPRGDHFPSRNRIISGLSIGVLVVEGAARSGTLITADMALSQGRDVYALPGSVTSRNSATPNKLLKAGACLVESAEDILEELEIPTSKSEKGQGKVDISHFRGTLTAEENAVLSAIEGTPKAITKIIYETGLQCGKVSSILVVLEMAKLVSKSIDGDYIAMMNVGRGNPTNE
ncbi:MAG: DNA-processing protein DprA [Actinomycetota bacterium]